ncbi:4-(cytidine 5'-diphospho)-2-C-methyl-D-erythritol kinase [Endothiovibrio diazotrophicus]
MTRPSFDLDWPAPAKLNLFLHVVGRRDDGYHLLQTVFQFLDYGDTLRFTPRDDGAVRLAVPLPGVAEEEDLTVRAAHRLREACGEARGVTIRVEKRLPMGGGLGGGSSDAATVLVALNHLWELGRTEDELARLGLSLGADVPVFVRGRAAWGEGVGERLTPVTLPEPWFLVAMPEVTVATGAVFGDPQLTRNSPHITIADFLSGAGRNDCEPLVRLRYPPVDELLRWLGRFGAARLTGTGACCFVAMADEAAARGALAELPSRWRGFVARGRNESLLHRRMTG